VRIQKLDKFSVTGEEEGGHFRAGDKCEWRCVKFIIILFINKNEIKDFFEIKIISWTIKEGL
jgi:hypothetical protein